MQTYRFIHKNVYKYSYSFKYICLSYLLNPSARAGYDTRSIF